MTDPHMPRVEAGEAEKPDLMDVAICDGKYRLIQSAEGRLRALRYGEEWRDLTGDTLVLALAQEVEALRAAALAPAPQDTAEAIAEVERLVRAYGKAETDLEWVTHLSDDDDECSRFGVKRKAKNAALADLLAVAPALANRAATAEAERDDSRRRHAITETEACNLASDVGRLEAALASLRAEREADRQHVVVAFASVCEARGYEALCGDPSGLAHHLIAAGQALTDVIAPRTRISAQKDRADG